MREAFQVCRNTEQKPPNLKAQHYIISFLRNKDEAILRENKGGAGAFFLIERKGTLR